MNRFRLDATILLVAMLAMFSIASATTTPFPLIGTPSGSVLTSSTGNYVTNTTLDVGQNTMIYVANIVNGIAPYTVNFLFTGPNSISGNTITLQGVGSGNYVTLVMNSLTANSVKLWIGDNGIYSLSNTIALTGSNSIYGQWTFNAVIADSSTNTLITNSIPIITVNPALGVSISPTSATYDAGQSSSITTTVSGGTPTFALSYTLSNSICGTLSTPPSNTLSADGTNTIVFTSNSALTATCTTTFTASVADGASTSVTKTATSSLTVNPALGTPTQPTISANKLDEGQPITFNTFVSGGTPLYTYNFIISSSTNSMNIITSNSQTSNSFTWTTSAPGNFVANVIVTDSATTNAVTNSIYSLPFVVYSTYSVSISPQTGTYILGQNETLTAVTSGGTSPFSYQWYNESNGTVTKMTGDTSSTMLVPFNLGGSTFKYMVSVEDSSSIPQISNSVVGTYTINYPPASNGGGVPPSIPPITTPPPSTNITNITKPSVNITHVTIPAINTTTSISVNVSNKLPLFINFTNMHTIVNVSTSSTTPSLTLVKIINMSISAPKVPTNYTLVSAENISVNTIANVSINVTQHYPCNINKSLIAPYMYKNSTWSKITPFAVNASACTISFAIPKDPIIGILESAPVTPTTTNVTTTTPPTTPTTNVTNVTTTTTPPSSSSNTGLIIVGVVIIIIIIAVAYYYYTKKGKK